MKKKKINLLGEKIESPLVKQKIKKLDKKKQRIMKKSNKIKPRKEKYYICPYCADLKTFTSILADCESGGPGMCDCQFTTLFWNPESQDLDVNTPRIYHEYVRISEEWYDCLKEIDNNVLRRNAFKQIPPYRRLD